VRAAIVAALLADAGVAAIAGTRVRPRLGMFGGLAPGDFTAEGELVGPALVVVAEIRARHPDDRGEGTIIRAVQSFALFGYAPAGLEGDAYAVIRELHRAARVVLHRKPLTPLEEPVRWLDTKWASYGIEQVEAPRDLPVIVARYDCTITDPL
jgi:hypothetical protein